MITELSASGGISTPGGESSRPCRTDILIVSRELEILWASFPVDVSFFKLLGELNGMVQVCRIVWLEI